MSRARRLEPAERTPALAEEKPGYGPGGPVGFEPGVREPEPVAQKPEAPNVLYYRHTFTQAEAEAFLALAATEEAAKAALADVERRQTLLEERITGLQAEAEGRAAERKQHEAERDAAADENRVEDIKAASAHIEALDLAGTHRAAVRERLEAEVAKLVAEAIPPARKAVKEAEKASSECAEQLRDKIARWEVDLVIADGLARWLSKDPGTPPWVELHPDADAVAFAQYVATLPDLTIRQAVKDREGFNALIRAARTPNEEPKLSDEQLAEQIAKLTKELDERRRGKESIRIGRLAAQADRESVAAWNARTGA